MGSEQGECGGQSLTPGKAFFRRIQVGVKSVKEAGKSGWRAGGRAQRAESSSPLTCTGTKKIRQWTACPYSFNTLSSSCGSHVDVHAHSNQTSKLHPCFPPANSSGQCTQQSCFILKRTNQGRKSLQALEVGLGLFGQRFPKYSLFGTCSTRQATCSRRAYFFGITSILF